MNNNEFYDDFIMLEIDWNDPNLADKAGDLFLEVYEQDRKRHAAEAAKAAMPPPAKPTANVKHYTYGPERLPEEVVVPGYDDKLLCMLNQLEAKLRAEMPENATPEIAAVGVVNNYLCEKSYWFIKRVLDFLMTDSRVYPERKPVINSTKLLCFNINEIELETEISNVMLYLALLNAMFPDEPRNAFVKDELQNLRIAGSKFYDLVGMIFTIPEIGRCKQTLELLLDKAGSREYQNEVTAYVRMVKQTERAIAKFEQNPNNVATLNKKIDTLRREIHNGNANNPVSQLVANMKLGNQTARITQQTDDYPALLYIKSPIRRKQILAVIKYTETNPIARVDPWNKKGKKFTLSKACKAVWNKNEKTWLKQNGACKSFKTLKSACYNLVKKHPEDDPFKYSTDE